MLFLQLLIPVKSKSVEITRTLKQEGFHRDLETVLSFKLEKEIVEKLTWSCQLLLVENLPSGVYVDVDQLSSLPDNIQVLVDSDVDIEAPEYASPPLLVYIFTNLTSDRSSITLPVHVRYHRPSNVSEYAQILIENPKIYSTCLHLSDYENTEGIGAPCDNQNSSQCLWNRLQVLYNEGKSAISLQVPIGVEQHSLFVGATTLLVTMTGCVILVWKIVKKSVDLQMRKKQL
ncbi:hypothetical protein SNE40_005578 [Patella caerulea]